jgi:hypothetical protein
VQVPARDIWDERGAVRWQTYRGWLGVEAEALATIDEVMLGYLAAFGPASLSDIGTWSGLPALREVADRPTPQPRVFLDENDREALDLPEARRPTQPFPRWCGSCPNTTMSWSPVTTAVGSTPTGDRCHFNLE